MAIEAIIYERGKGLPDTGSYVPGYDGELYKVVEVGRIFTGGSPGAANSMHAKVELASWKDDVEDDDDVFPASVEVDQRT